MRESDTMRSMKSSIILSIKLASEASAIIEKLIWISFAILGSTYFGYLLHSQKVSWDEHSVMIFKGYESISEIDFPAVTFCTRTNSKYAIVERIGNRLSLDSEFTKRHILPIRNAVIENNLNEDSSMAKKLYDDECIGDEYYVFKKLDCKVKEENYIHSLIYYAHLHNSLQKAQLLYQYGKSNNVTLNELYIDIIDAVSQTWHVPETIDEYFQTKIEYSPKETNITINITDESEWAYFHRLRRLLGQREQKGYQSKWKWFSNKLGSYLIRRLVFQLNSQLWSSTLMEADMIDDIFKIPETNISLSNIAHLYSINDYEQISDIDDRGVHQREYLANFPKSFFNCFKKEHQHFKKVIVNNEDNENLYEDEKIKPTRYMIKSPCYENNRHVGSCQEYCKWSNQLFQGNMNRKDFLKIMKFALPQGKIVLKQDLDEENLAMKIVGPINSKIMPRHAPHPLVIFCKYFKNQAWQGDDIGMFGKVCHDFQATPTHVGTCVSSGINVQNVLKYNDQKENQKVKKIKGGTYSGVTTYILDTGQGKMKQTYERTKKAEPENPETVQMQIHPNYEMAQILYDENQDYKTRSIKLEAGHEYNFEVSINGQMSLEGFRSLSLEQRKCNLESEVTERSWFKKYSQKNCMYECHARLAAEKCGCIPWDFYHLGEFQECDVFGRTCFINTMENLTHMVKSTCQDCPKDCDYFKYSTELRSDEKIIDDIPYGYGGKYVNFYDSQCYNYKIFCDYLKDTNFTLKETYSMKLIHDQDKISSMMKQFEGTIVVNLRFSTPEAEMTVLEARYSFVDKIAGLGGSFGIFTQLTGCTVLAFTHLFLTLIKELFQYFPILKRDV